jgi:hypothetical protein
VDDVVRFRRQDVSSSFQVRLVVTFFPVPRTEVEGVNQERDDSNEPNNTKPFGVLHILVHKAGPKPAQDGVQNNGEHVLDLKKQVAKPIFIRWSRQSHSTIGYPKHTDKREEQKDLLVCVVKNPACRSTASQPPQQTNEQTNKRTFNADVLIVFSCSRGYWSRVERRNRIDETTPVWFVCRINPTVVTASVGIKT